MRPRPAILLLTFSALLLSAEKDGNRVPTFADEFNGRELDLSRWAPHAPLDRVRAPAAVTVSGGQLHIVSGSAGTFGTFAQTYGRFEIRCRIPAGRGFRARFRLLPIPLGTLPAIDVFETTGGAPSKVLFANHWGTEQTERSFSESFTGPDLSAAFHTLAVEWDRDRIVWFIDGKEKFQSVDGIPHQPMFMLLDVTAGSDTSTASPASFDIDYIRVYQRP
jgi:beta-glucanase (GH16 family)